MLKEKPKLPSEPCKNEEGTSPSKMDPNDSEAPSRIQAAREVGRLDRRTSHVTVPQETLLQKRVKTLRQGVGRMTKRVIFRVRFPCPQLIVG